MSSYVEKRKLLFDSPALTAFKANLLSDGTYTYDNDILDRSFACLPYYMREADLIMVSGAYKTGAIAGFNKDGDIVDMSYSTSYSINKVEDNTNVPLTLPYLTKLGYNGGEGYILQKGQITYGSQTDITLASNRSWTLQNINASNVGGIPRIASNGNMGQHRFMRANVSVASNGGFISFSVVVRSADYGVSIYTYQATQKILEDVPIDRTDGIIVNLQTGKLHYKSGNMSNYQIVPLGDDWYYLSISFKIRNVSPDLNFLFTQVSLNIHDYSSNNMTLNFVGDVNKYVEVRQAFVTRNNQLDVTNNGGGSAFNIPDTILGDIYCANDTLVHIKTSMVLKDVLITGGTNFNLMDHIDTGDKLICFAMKELAFETFLSNLIADGTYTFDENVLRDSYENIKNEIENNSTLRNRFIESDVIVLPYAYKTGYVAGCDWDGNIVPIPFERNSNISVILNGDSQRASENEIGIDNFFSTNVGYIFESSVEYFSNRTRNLYYVSGDINSLDDPIIFEEQTRANPDRHEITSNSGIKTFNDNNYRVRMRGFIKHGNDILPNYLVQSGYVPLTLNLGTTEQPPYYKYIPSLDLWFIDYTTTQGSWVIPPYTANIEPFLGSEWRLPIIGLKHIHALHTMFIDRDFNKQRYSFKYYDNPLNVVYQGGYERDKDFLDTTTYSKISCLCEEDKKLKTGFYTDPQTLITNDKIYAIFLTK